MRQRTFVALLVPCMVSVALPHAAAQCVSCVDYEADSRLEPYMDPTVSALTEADALVISIASLAPLEESTNTAPRAS